MRARMAPRRALGALHAGALMFGLAGVFGVLAQASAAMIVFGRAAFAVLTLGLFMSLSRQTGWQRLTAREAGQLFFAGVLLTTHWVTFFIAVKLGGVAIGTLGFASFPAFTVLLEGLAFGEKIHKRELSLVAIVTLGLVLVTPAFDFAAQSTQGLCWGIGSGLLFAILSLVNRAGAPRVGAVQAALCQNLVVAICLLPFIATSLPGVSRLDWLWIALLGVFCTGIAHSLFVASLKVVKARTAAVVFALEPVYGIAFAWLIFSQAPSARMFLGGALIVATIALSSLLGGQRSTSRAEQPKA